MKQILLLLLWLAALPAAAEKAVSEARIHRAVEDFVRAELQGQEEEGLRLQVEVRWQGEVVLEEPGEPTIRVRRLSDRPLRGPTVLRVEIGAAGRTQREMSVTADVRYLRPVLVATRQLGRGETLAQQLVEVAERDVTNLEREFYVEVAQIEGLRTRRTVGAGEVIAERHTEKVPLILRGAQVEMIAETSTLRISTLGVAMQDGGRGERIRVRNETSGKMVYGQVVDGRTVRVDR